MLRMSSIETMVISQRASAMLIRDREVLAMAKALNKLLSFAHARATHNSGVTQGAPT